MSYCPVTVQFGIQLLIFAIYINPFCVKVYSAVIFLISEFFVALIVMAFCF